MRETDIEAEIQETMGLLDHPEVLPPDPSFPARVRARLAEKGGKRKGFSPVLKPALIALLLAANVITAAWFWGGQGRPASDGNRQASVKTLAGDLNLTGDERTPIFDR